MNGRHDVIRKLKPYYIKLPLKQFKNLSVGLSAEIKKKINNYWRRPLISLLKTVERPFLFLGGHMVRILPCLKKLMVFLITKKLLIIKYSTKLVC